MRLALAVVLLCPTWLWAVGQGNVEITLNEGTGLGNKFYIGMTNKVTVRVTNDENLNGMALPFAFAGYSGPFIWKPVDSTGVGTGYKYTRHLQYPASIWELGFTEYKGSLNGTLPDTFAIGAVDDDGSFPMNPTLTSQYQWDIYIPPGSTSGQVCIDNIFLPPAWTWSFAPLTTSSYAPNYFDCINSAENNPDCPAACFDVDPLNCGDANGDGIRSITDANWILQYIIGAGPYPGPEAECDGLTGLNILDAVYLIRYLFCMGPAPICPATQPECETTPNPDFILVHGNIFPANSSTYTMPIKLSLLAEVSAVSLPLRIRIDGGLPLSLVPHTGGGVWFLANTAANIDSGVVISYGSGSCANTSGCKDYGTVDITMDPQSYDRVISVEVVDFQSSRAMVIDADRNCYLPVVTGAQFAACNVGTICDGSYTDPALVLCPGGDAVFQVYLRNALGDPVAGDSSVYIDLVNCDGVLSCPPGGPVARLYPINRSRSDGILRFYAPAGGCNNACQAIISAPCGTIATVPVRSVDTNGDFGVSLSGDFVFTECNNYNGVPGIQIEDQDVFYDHIGHYCGLTPCQRFSYDFQLNPSANLSPGQEVTLSLILRNNNFAACQVGAIGFFATGFGTGGSRTLIDVVGYNQPLLPGRSDTVSISYTVPGIGHGCLLAEFTTDCCSTTVVLEQCAQSQIHCAGSTELCYDVYIRLLTTPIFDIVIPTTYLAPGWSINQVYVPAAFPLTQPDSIKYQICTPPDPELGDDSRVPVEIWYDPLGFSADIFESQVFITPRTGDADGNCLVSISDAVYLIYYIFAGGPAPVPCQAGDVDCSGIVNISDAVYLINFIFVSGPSPCLPDPSTPAPNCSK